QPVGASVVKHAAPTANAGLASAEDVPGKTNTRHKVLVYRTHSIFWNAGITGKEKPGRSCGVDDRLSSGSIGSGVELAHAMSSLMQGNKWLIPDAIVEGE